MAEYGALVGCCKRCKKFFNWTLAYVRIPTRPQGAALNEYGFCEDCVESWKKKAEEKEDDMEA